MNQPNEGIREQWSREFADIDEHLWGQDKADASYDWWLNKIDLALAKQSEIFIGKLKTHFGTQHDTFCQKKGEQFKKCATCVSEDIISTITKDTKEE